MVCVGLRSTAAMRGALAVATGKSDDAPVDSDELSSALWVASAVLLVLMLFACRLLVTSCCPAVVGADDETVSLTSRSEFGRSDADTDTSSSINRRLR